MACSGAAPITIFAVRHGNTFTAEQQPVWIGSRTDLPLTEEGRRQAERMAAFLQREGIAPAAVYAGRLKRQQEAAKIIASSFAAGVTTSEALNELDYGPWEGLTTEEIKARWSVEYRDWEEAGRWPEGLFGEPLEGRIERLHGFLKHLQASHTPGDKVVLLSSNGTLRFFELLKGNRWAELAGARKIMELKVRTGNYCVLNLAQGAIPDSLEILRWNVSPGEAPG